jgi:hypothetical protein
MELKLLVNHMKVEKKIEREQSIFPTLHVEKFDMKVRANGNKAGDRHHISGSRGEKFRLPGTATRWLSRPLSVPITRKFGRFLPKVWPHIAISQNRLALSIPTKFLA